MGWAAHGHGQANLLLQLGGDPVGKGWHMRTADDKYSSACLPSTRYNTVQTECIMGRGLAGASRASTAGRRIQVLLDAALAASHIMTRSRHHALCLQVVWTWYVCIACLLVAVFFIEHRHHPQRCAKSMLLARKLFSGQLVMRSACTCDKYLLQILKHTTQDVCQHDIPHRSR